MGALFLFFVTVLAITGTQASQAQTQAPASGQAAVELVQTPGGTRPSYQVIEVEPGQAVRRDSPEITNIIDVDQQAVIQSILASPVVSPINAQSSEKTAAKDNGWITYTLWTAPQGEVIKKFVTHWRVPDAPEQQNGQLLYLFNGLMNTEHSTILQPVLQWGVSDAGGGKSWAVASWYVDNNGQTYHSPLVAVQSGQELSGVMTLTETSGAKSSYVSEFEGVPATSLVIQNIETLQQASETLEAYDVQDCGQYPQGSTAFSDIALALMNPGASNVISSVRSNSPSSVSWTQIDELTDCGQHSWVTSPSSTKGEVDLFYGNGSPSSSSDNGNSSTNSTSGLK
jgi:hypothetical protein